MRQLTSRLTPRGWAILGGSALAAVLVIYLFMSMVSKPTYSTLATGLEPAQTGKMTSTLDTQGISYELQNNGTALAVQSNETARARVALAGAGLLNNTQPGFKLFEKTSLGESQFDQQVTYQRALQGQLEQTIDNIQGVSGAQVELVMPSAQNQLFGENQNASSAAVLLGGTGDMSATSVHGIAQLVASSVPGLQIGKVTITNGSGQLLWPSQNGEGVNSTTGKQAAEERYDDDLEANLDAMLAQTLGAGKAEVQVNATLNTNQTTQESLTYGKSGVPLQQSKNLETLAGNGSGAGGATGTANIPAYTQTGASGQVQLQARSERVHAGGGQDRRSLDDRPRRRRKPARLRSARPHRARRLDPRDQGSRHQRRRHPDQARRHDLDRPDGLSPSPSPPPPPKPAAACSATPSTPPSGSPPRSSCSSRLAPCAAASARRSTTNPPGCASSSCRSVSPSSSARTPPGPPRRSPRPRPPASAPARPAIPSAAKSSSSPRAAPSASPSSCAAGCRRTDDRASDRAS